MPIMRFIEIFQHFATINNDTKFEYFPGKMSDFVSLTLFGFTIVIELRNLDFGSHWNTLIFFDQKMISDFNMFYEAVSNLV